MNGFENGFHQWNQCIFLVVVEARKFFSEIFFWFSKFGCTLPPCKGKPFVLEDLCLDMGTSVASALTGETGFEIMKCISDVVRMGSKFANFQVFSKVSKFIISIEAKTARLQFWVRPR